MLNEKLSYTEAVPGTPEVVEDRCGETVRARHLQLRHFQAWGPPDLVHITKTLKTVTGKVADIGYYHFVNGHDVGSAASISAYIVRLFATGMEPSSWYSGGGWRIKAVSWFSYNAFSKIDIVAEVTFPGGLIAYGLDTEGNKCDLTDDLWEELLVSSTFRALTDVGSYTQYPCLKSWHPIPNLQQEEKICALCVKLVHKWALLGSNYEVNLVASSPVTSRVCDALIHYFTRMCRFKQMENFFAELAKQYPEFNFVVAMARSLLGSTDSARQLIQDSLAEFPESVSLHLAKSQMACDEGKLAEATAAGHEACILNPNNNRAFIQLARAFYKAKEYEKTFQALNNANLQPHPVDHFLRAVLPGKRRLTTVAPGFCKGSDVYGVYAKRLKEERTYHQGTDEILEELPSRLMSEDEEAVFDVLVSILDDINWDTLLDIRSKSFFMESDVKTPPNKNDVETKKNSKSSQDMGDSVKVSSLLRKQGATKMVCKPWLDFLVTNLYKDLRAMAAWEAENQILNEREGPGLPELDVQLSDTKRPPADWLRRANLAKRLHKMEYAKFAYEMCMRLSSNLKVPSVTACVDLLAITLEGNDITEALYLTDSLWTYLVTNSDKSAGNEVFCSFPEISSGVFSLISKHGLRKVREVISAPKLDVEKQRLQDLLLDAVGWQVDGFDR